MSQDVAGRRGMSWVRPWAPTSAKTGPAWMTVRQISKSPSFPLPKPSGGGPYSQAGLPRLSHPSKPRQGLPGAPVFRSHVCHHRASHIAAE